MKYLLSAVIFIFCFNVSALDCTKPQSPDELQTCQMQVAGKAGDKKKAADAEEKTLIKLSSKKVEQIDPENPERDPGELKDSFKRQNGQLPQRQ